jgi:hypothetical protein
MADAKTLQLTTDSRMKDLQEHPAAGKFQPASESIDSPTAAKGF